MNPLLQKNLIREDSNRLYLKHLVEIQILPDLFTSNMHDVKGPVGSLHDISLGGCCVLIPAKDFRSKIDETYFLRINLPNLRIKTIQCRIAWYQSRSLGEVHVGLQFISLSDENRVILKEYLRDLLEPDESFGPF